MISRVISARLDTAARAHRAVAPVRSLAARRALHIGIMRSKDRLAELHQLANGDGIYHDTVEVALLRPASAASHAAYEKEVDQMFQEVERIRRWVHELSANTQLLRRLHADPTFHTNKHLQDHLDSVITQSQGVGLKICGALRQFEARVSAGAQRNDALARMSRLQYACTRALYSDALADHHRALNALRDHQLNLLYEQIKLTNLSISDDECQSLLDTKNISLFVDNVQAETAEAKLALREMEARHAELARVEASLVDLRDQFLQLAHLVAMQQDQIDSVEYYALQASEHVEYGGQELLKGTVSHSKAKRKKLSLFICLASGAVIVLLVLIVT